MEISWTGTMSEAEADKLLENIREIMAETGLPFGPAVNVYIKRKYHGLDPLSETSVDSERDTR